jgi:amidase
MTDIWRMGAVDLAAAIRSKQLKSTEVVEAHLARIAAVNPKLNAVTVVLADEALAAAKAADAAVARGAALPPLHGVPMTVKENLDLTGSATTQGLVAMAQAMPPADAPHVAQMKAAGAIPIGRTNLPDFGLRWHTDNELRGPTKNPWDASRTPGGSSGGEAAALATGMTPLGLGNDLGGSLRWPSQCCGTAAIKPTFGRVPWMSQLPPADSPLTLQLWAVQGPMARHVRDLRVALRCMAGPDGRDPWYMPVPLEGPAVPRRVAVVYDPAGEGVDTRVAAGVRRAADALRDAGYEVVDAEPPAVAAGRDLWGQILMAEVKAALLPVLGPVLGKDARDFLETAIEALPQLDLAGYVGAFAARQGLAREWSLFFQRYPLVLGPVATIQPFTVGFDLDSAGVRAVLKAQRLVVIPNLLGLPTAVVPVGVDAGLSQGVQLIGDRYREDVCLDAAQAIEERLGVVTPIDPR